MPLRPVTGTLQLPLETAADAWALLEAVRLLPEETNAVRRGWKARDLSDHLFYLGAVCPDLAAPLRSEWARLDDEALPLLSLQGWIPLLAGSDDADADRLASPEEPRLSMLAAVGTPYADARLSDLALRHGLRTELALMGIAIEGGRAVRRFTPWRRALRGVPSAGGREALRGMPNPIGLPLRDVAADETIAWHYLSLDLAGVEGLPPLPLDRLHLVSPRAPWGWTLFAEVEGGRYRTRSVVLDEEEDDDPPEEADNDAAGGLGHAELLPYDDRLTYTNGHVQSTEGVVGTVGGPPIGLYPNPNCAACGRLMFHVLTVDAGVREYGDGFRSLFVCERCVLVACNATSYN